MTVNSEINNDIDYDAKYIKYKNKYYELKNKLFGGRNNNKIKLLTFTAKWCMHCNNFMPTYNKLKNNNKYNIDFVNFDSEENKQEMIDYKITGFPTIYLQKNNQLIPYNGNRDENDLINFIESYTKKI